MSVHQALSHKMFHYIYNSRNLVYWNNTGSILRASPHTRWYPYTLCHPLPIHNRPYIHNKSQSEYWYTYVHTGLFPLWHTHQYGNGLVHQSYHRNLSACCRRAHRECTDVHSCIWTAHQNRLVLLLHSLSRVHHFHHHNHLPHHNGRFFWYILHFDRWIRRCHKFGMLKWKN